MNTPAEKKAEKAEEKRHDAEVKAEAKAAPVPEPPKAGKVFFLKQLASNRIPDHSGKAIAFERISDSRGIIALEVGKDDKLIADLNRYVEQKKGGVSVIEDEATYEDLKKNFPHVPRPVLAAPRVYDPKTDPFARKASAQPVQVVGDAGAVEASGNANVARGAAGLGSLPVSKGKPVRTGKPGQPIPAVVSDVTPKTES